MVLAIAHRGDPHGHWENTVPAVLAAMEQGADLVEVDVTTTRDNTVILLHDATLTRLWEHDAAVADLSIDQVRAACEGGRYEIPTFDQVMALTAAAGRGLMIDLTVPWVASHAARIVADFDAFGDHVFAGVTDALLALRRDWPQARIALSWNRIEPPDNDLLTTLRPEYFNPNKWLLDQPLIVRMHSAGYQVSTWTVDSPTDMARLMEMGVDAIITNRLRYLLTVRAHHHEDPQPARRAEEEIPA
jgi:glycerophosphoryl diester phosphodiesterase